MPYRRISGKLDGIKYKKDLRNNNKGQALKLARRLGLREVHKDKGSWLPGKDEAELKRELERRHINAS